MTDWRDRVEEERQDRESAEDERQDAIAEHAARNKDRCRTRIVNDRELWKQHVSDYGTCMTDGEYLLLDEAARAACAGNAYLATSLMRRAWGRSLDLAAETLALAEAEAEFAPDEDPDVD